MTEYVISFSINRQCASEVFDSYVLATHAIHRGKFEEVLKRHNIHFSAVDGPDSGDVTQSLEKIEVCNYEY